MYRYTGKNTRPFTAVCDCSFGRKVIKTLKKSINASNIVEELNKAMYIHRQNATEIDYLDKYYRGDQPILYRKKANRPEVNNRVVVNLAKYVVDTKASEMAGEPIQYVLRGTDKEKSKEIAKLNTVLANEGKDMDDIDLCTWRSVCGTAYRYIGNDDGNGSLLDETDFYMDVPDPRYTFVVYYQNKRPAFSCQITENEDGKTQYLCFTNSEWFIIDGKKIEDSGINGNLAIPVVEYPNNSRRLSDIEMTIGITDAINVLASDRNNAIEQFVSSWVKFVNCEIDKDLYQQMRQEGALVVKSNNGSENKADVDIISQELNQTEGQVVMADLFEKFLVIHGMANRQGNTGGDTQGAVLLRNGHYDAEKRAELAEPIFKNAERMVIRILLNRMRINQGTTLIPSDIEVKISRSKMDNMQVKAQTLQMLLTSGVKPERAIKTVGLFSDPEQVAVESKKRMDILYPETEQTNNQEVIEVVE